MCQITIHLWRCYVQFFKVKGYHLKWWNNVSGGWYYPLMWILTGHVITCHRCFPHIVNLACKSTLTAVTSLDYAQEDAADYDPTDASITKWDYVAVLRQAIRMVCEGLDILLIDFWRLHRSVFPHCDVNPLQIYRKWSIPIMQSLSFYGTLTPAGPQPISWSTVPSNYVW